ncbi:hypothetical protein [Ralstonia holmesii]|uniref:hypothetical protein n=1 Tax=Ralstonia holmesii TaxID=3058602 RepID=UPI0028F61F19|nr:hypothetical protein [Ralstonia sp. LMG 32967]CAJ0698830.1 hypothetical protein R11007_02898 [Ralstonia sp. LMG 32967]
MEVTINQTAPTPSQQIMADAAAEVTITDSADRVITLRKPGAIAKLRFIEAMGESSINPLWVGITSQLMYVAAINGEAVATPRTKNEIEALYQRLDDHGVDAISKALPGKFGIGGGEVSDEAVKKS